MKSVHLSLYVSQAAHAALVSRAESASTAAGVPIKATALAAALLHGALGLRPDGSPLAERAPPVESPETGPELDAPGGGKPPAEEAPGGAQARSKPRKGQAKGAVPEPTTETSEALTRLVAGLPALASAQEERRKERIQKEWIPMLMEKTGATREQAIDALVADRRRLSIRYGDVGRKSPKPGLVRFNAKRKKPG